MLLLRLNIQMGGCQNYGPFLGTLNIRCRIIIGIQKGTIILTTTHIFIAQNPTARVLQLAETADARTNIQNSEGDHLLKGLDSAALNILLHSMENF